MLSLTLFTFVSSNRQKMVSLLLLLSVWVLFCPFFYLSVFTIFRFLSLSCLSYRLGWVGWFLSFPHFLFFLFNKTKIFFFLFQNSMQLNPIPFLHNFFVARVYLSI